MIDQHTTMLAALSEHFPTQAVRQRRGGGNTVFDYVAGPDIIRRLIRATQGQWSWHIKTCEFRPLPPYRDRSGEMKEQSLVVVMGELTIPGLGTRAGIGVQKITEAGGEDLVKGASTDALKKAATLFGVALELYGPDFEEDDTPPPPPPARTPAPSYAAPQPRYATEPPPQVQSPQPPAASTAQATLPAAATSPTVLDPFVADLAATAWSLVEDGKAIPTVWRVFSERRKELDDAQWTQVTQEWQRLKAALTERDAAVAQPGKPASYAG